VQAWKSKPACDDSESDRCGSSMRVATAMMLGFVSGPVSTGLHRCSSCTVHWQGCGWCGATQSCQVTCDECPKEAWTTTCNPCPSYSRCCVQVVHSSRQRHGDSSYDAVSACSYRDVVVRVLAAHHIPLAAAGSASREAAAGVGAKAQHARPHRTPALWASGPSHATPARSYY
jgi:hypothetical protein